MCEMSSWILYGRARYVSIYEWKILRWYAGAVGRSACHNNKTSTLHPELSTTPTSDPSSTHSTPESTPPTIAECRNGSNCAMYSISLISFGNKLPFRCPCPEGEYKVYPEDTTIPYCAKCPNGTYTNGIGSRKILHDKLFLTVCYYRTD